MALVTSLGFDSVHAVAEAAICNKALWRIGAEPIKDTDEDTKSSRVCKSIYAATRDELLRMYPFNFSTKMSNIPIDSLFTGPTGRFSRAYKLEDHIQFTGYSDAGITIGAILGISDFDSMIGRKVYGTNVQDGTRVVSADEDTLEITLDRPTLGPATDFTAFLPVLKLLEVDSSADTLSEIVGGGVSRRLLCDAVTGTSINGDYLEVKYSEQVIDPEKFDTMFSDALVLRIASKISITMSSVKGIMGAMQQEFAAIMRAAQDLAAEERQIDSPDTPWTDRTGTAESY